MKKPVVGPIPRRQFIKGVAQAAAGGVNMGGTWSQLISEAKYAQAAGSASTSVL